MKFKVIFSLMLSVVVHGAMASASSTSSMGLDEVWDKIHTGSSAQKAADLQVEASREAKLRAERHWLPRVYLDARSYQTNDPGASFIGLLEQRSLLQSDFNPDAINHPDSHIYTRGALGVDLPLYEGGFKTSQSRLQEHVSISQEKSSVHVQVQEYSMVAKSYGSIGLLNQQKEKLSELDQVIQRLLKSYQLGVKSNPVGYSGLLGLKSLANRLKGLLQQYESQRQAYYAALKEMGLEDAAWSPIFEDSVKYVEKYLAAIKEGESFKLQALKEDKEIAVEASQMEKARYLPRVGAFAEASAFNGSRDTANSYMAGLYLQWNLFSPSDYGSLREAQLKAMAADHYSQAMAQKERAEKKAADQSVVALKQNIQLLNDSQKILAEQTQVTETLFKNGSINALQFVEVLSRRADLISAQTEAGLELIKTSSEGVLRTHFEIPLKVAESK